MNGSGVEITCGDPPSQQTDNRAPSLFISYVTLRSLNWDPEDSLPSQERNTVRTKTHQKLWFSVYVWIPPLQSSDDF